MASRQRSESVFLNVPFDRQFEPLFLALIAGVVGVGATPRCVLQIPDSGAGRLNRLLDLIGDCRSSIHDMSRVALSKGVPRFNMPFELGMACALARREGHHRFFVFEERPYRILKSLSDLNGIDPQIHGGTRRGVLRGVLNCFTSNRARTSLKELEELYRDVRHVAAEAKRLNRVKTVFSRTVFNEVVAAAIALAT
jgi:hypothetical protein